MTKIEFYKKNNQFVGLEVSGHTGKAEAGQDILCSAISTATQMVVVGIKEELKLNPFVEISDGYLKIKLSDSQASNEGTQLLMKTCYGSLKSIVKDEKKYVKLEVKNV